MIHRLKIKKEYADAICGNVKHFEVRKNDRKYEVGDIIVFYCINTEELHGIEERAFFVSYMLTHNDFPEGICEGYCVLSLARLDDDMAYYFAKRWRKYDMNRDMASGEVRNDAI